MVYNQGMTLKELRRLHNLTEQQMAERLGMSRPGIQKIERGAHTSTATLIAYAEGLGYDFLTVAAAWKVAHASQKTAYPQ